MEEAVIATFNEVNFIEGETFLTQQNWQEFFGPAIKNGVYEGLEPRNYLGSTTYTNGRTFITDGTVFANGICAKISTANGYTDIGTCPTNGVYDRLICARVYFDAQTAQLIQKTNVMEIAEGGSPSKYTSANAMKTFAHDETFRMERNETYWDIPIFYQGIQSYEWSSLGLDLRRIINKEQQDNPEDTCFKGYYPGKYKISGKNTYFINAEGNVTYHFALDMIDKPDGATIVIHRDGSISAQNPTYVSFTHYGATNNFLSSDADDFTGFNPSVFQINTLGTNLPYSITSSGDTFIKINYAGTQGELSDQSTRSFYPFLVYIQKF